MTDRPKLELLVGKYFIATFPHWDGRVEAVIDDCRYFVRFDPVVTARPRRSPLLPSMIWSEPAGKIRKKGRLIGCFLILPTIARNFAHGWRRRKTRTSLA
jgi:hypothetical protein